jgi:hypothetical protein
LRQARSPAVGADDQRCGLDALHAAARPAANARDPTAIRREALDADGHAQFGARFDRRFDQHLIEHAAPRTVAERHAVRFEVRPDERKVSQVHHRRGDGRAVGRGDAVEQSPTGETPWAVPVNEMSVRNVAWWRDRRAAPVALCAASVGAPAQRAPITITSCIVHLLPPA